MKARVWLLMMIAEWSAAAQAPPAPSVEGHWLATISAGSANLRLVLHATRGPQGLTGTLDSIDQGAMGLPLSSLHQNGAAVEFALQRLGASFEGTLNPGGTEITGQWKQGGYVAPLVFKRSENLPVLARPQEPKKPYPYDEQEVSYENVKARIRFAGTLTLPRTGGPHPAVLLITGSGPQDRNEAIAGHKPFLVLADYLTRRGIAVLRVDDRGMGGSTGKVDEGTSEDFASDALAGVAFLKSRKDIREVGLVGHSEGGLIAPLAATQSGDVAFIVMMAGPGLTGEEILELQGDLILRAMGAPEEVAARNRELQRLIFEALKQEKDNAAVVRRFHEGAAKMKAGLSPDQQKGMEALIARAESQLKFTMSPWFRHFLVYDPKPTLAKVKVPVLAVNGEKDLQVPPHRNLPAIVKALESGGNRDYSVVKLAGLNHLFQTCTSGSPAEYSRIEETLAPAALQVIGDWILRHVRSAVAQISLP